MATNPPEHERPEDGRDLQRLIAQCLDGVLDATELQELERRLETDEQARNEYRRLVSLHGDLAWHCRGTTPAVEEGEGFQLRLARQSDEASSRQGLVKPGSSLLRHLRNPRKFKWVLAASLVPLLLGVWWSGALQARRAPDYVATVAALDKCVWGRGDLGGSRRVEAGRSIELLQGRADLTFETGVHLAVVGPASLSIVSAAEADLAWGQLVAEVPPEATDFVVKTPHAKIDRASARFGVEASSNETEVHSLLGELQVVPAVYRSNRQASSLPAGKSARFSRGGSPPADGIADPDVFPDLADGPTKVLNIRGPVEFLDRAPTSIGPCSLESDEVAYLVPERVGAVIATKTLATFVEPGRHSIYAEPWPEVEPGTKVDSYLLVFNPVGAEPRDESTGLPPAVKGGEITFNRPIVAIVAFADHLQRTDEYLGAVGTEYLSVLPLREPRWVNRGIWKRGLHWRDEALSNGQFIEISEDRCTLRFNFVVYGRGPDQARVLVQSAQQ